MASRRETKQQQREVEQSLRSLLGGGSLKGGAMLPSVTELAQEHGVSRYIAHRALGTVEQEGLFHAVPKVGSFARTQGSRSSGSGMFVVLSDEESLHPYRAEIQTGFDSRVAWHGGAALEVSTSSDSWREWPVEGVFLLVRQERLDLVASLGLLDMDVPCVRIGSERCAGEQLDLVSFDDEGGGFLATQHLLEGGFKSIAFAGVHAPASAKSPKEWSIEREAGWRRALREAGLPFHGRAFHPNFEDDDCEGARRIGHSLSGVLLKQGDVRAVVAANDALALGLIDGFREARVPRDQWPALVSFDNSEEARRLNLTSLRLPWSDLGQEAADLLWSRVRGQLPPHPQHRAIAMRLIPRLSCREKWPLLCAV